jgi:type VI protein secretion system component VasK
MEERIRGSFPGGPKRSVSAPGRKRPPRLQRVADIEAGIARRTVELSSRRRRQRVATGFVVAMALAGGAGGWIGFASHRSAEELTAAHAASRERDLDISWQVNRTLLQLWKMEDVEALRDKGLTR